MKKCIIVGASKDSQIKFDINDEDYVIASDGGLEFLLANNYKIDKVIGDFDSLKYVPYDLNPLVLNPIKDVTDTHVALEEGIKEGYKEFHIYGCLGGRIEHSFATIQDCYKYAFQGIKIYLYTKDRIITFLNNGKFEMEKENGFISVFALDKASGVTIKNLKYEVENITLDNMFPLGVSNEFCNKKATISVKKGCLLIVY